MSQRPPPEEQVPNGRVQKPRRVEVWGLVVGLLILVGLLGHLLNQQQVSKRTESSRAESERRESAPSPAAPPTQSEAVPKSQTPRQSAGTNANTRKPSPVVYAVTHKHRLRDCHGTLTMTREGIRFQSDEPQDSFAVGRDDVTIEGDALRIRDKTWRFEFDDGVSAARIFQDWKTGTLRPVSPR